MQPQEVVNPTFSHCVRMCMHRMLYIRVSVIPSFIQAQAGIYETQVHIIDIKELSANISANLLMLHF